MKKNKISWAAPYIPIIGIPLTFYTYVICGDESLDNLTVCISSAVVQGCSLFGAFYLLVA